MLETYVRNKIQPFFDLVALPISRLLSANGVTLIAFITGIISGMCISIHQMLLGLIFLLASGSLDILDGTVARLLKTDKKVGAYVDLISDRMVEAAVILGFSIAYPEHYLCYITFFIAVLLHFSTFVAAGALFTNSGSKSMHYDKSIVERAEAFVIFCLMMLFPAYIFPLLMSFNIIVLFAGVSRFIRVLKLFT